MSWLSVFGIFVTLYILSVSADGSSYPPNHIEKLPPVKYIAGKPLIRDEEYIHQIQADYRKVNETYNALCSEFIIHKDFPEDTKVKVKIYRPSLLLGRPKLLRKFVFRLGDQHSIYHKYLGSGPLHIMQGSNTIKKGHYKSDDFGHFEFQSLLSELELKKYPQFQMFYTLKSHHKVLFRNFMQFQSLWKQ